MNTLRIQVGDGITDAEAIFYVSRVVQDGRISDRNTSYCFATVFTQDKIQVFATRTKTGDTFRVERQKNTQ